MGDDATRQRSLEATVVMFLSGGESITETEDICLDVLFL